MNTRAHQGFSLIELSIVMVIIGILLAASIAVMGPSMKEAAATRTEKFLEANMNALKGYAGANGAVPTAAGFSALLSYPNDGGNNAFLYDLDANLTTAGAICARNSTNLSVLTTGGATISNVAFILYSRGNDGGTDLTSTGAAPEIYDMDPYTDTWDDLAGWVTLSELKGKAECGSAIQILSNSTLAACGDNPAVAGVSDCNSISSYGVTNAIAVTGGVVTSGDYYWCLDSSSNPDVFTASVGGSSLASLDCGSALTSSYTQGDSLDIQKSGIAVRPNTATMVFYVRDEQGNQSWKGFGIPVY